jgi:hypothetical protein
MAGDGTVSQTMEVSTDGQGLFEQKQFATDK